MKIYNVHVASFLIIGCSDSINQDTENVFFDVYTPSFKIRVAKARTPAICDTVEKVNAFHAEQVELMQEALKRVRGTLEKREYYNYRLDEREVLNAATSFAEKVADMDKVSDPDNNPYENNLYVTAQIAFKQGVKWFKNRWIHSKLLQ